MIIGGTETLLEAGFEGYFLKSDSSEEQGDLPVRNVENDH